MILLAIWLILTGLLPLLNVRVSTTVNTVLAVLAIAAGLLILLRRWDMDELCFSDERRNQFQALHLWIIIVPGL